MSLKEQFTGLIQSALESAQRTLLKADLSPDLLPTFEQFSFEAKEDPFSREDTLSGRWADSNSQRRGNLVINSDGSLMLEIDLICEMPKSAGRWAELVSVWGQSEGSLRSEITLMPSL